METAPRPSFIRRRRPGGLYLKGQPVQRDEAVFARGREAVTFAVTALLLALIGIYGVIAYSVAQRTQEIGIRMALGARRAEVVRMVVRQGVGISLAGIVVGLIGAVGLTRFMETLLYEVEPNDPQTFAAVVLVLAVTALAACWIPALRAATVDPVTTLRGE